MYADFGFMSCLTAYFKGLKIKQRIIYGNLTLTPNS